MAWTDGVDYSTGQLISATIWNNYLGAAGNIDLTAPGVVTTAGDTVYATADNTIARLPSSGEGGKFLRMNAGETAPEYATALTSLVADTTPQLGGQLDVNGNAIGDGTLELLKFSETGSAVNELTVTNAATGNPPALSATGGDANINLKLAGKGTGGLEIGATATTASKLILAEDTDNGAHTITVAAPAAVTGDITLTLPDGDGDASQFLQTDGDGALSWAAGGGLTGADTWRVNTGFSSPTEITANWEQDDTDAQGVIGSGMAESSGVFTFPDTGYWLVSFYFSASADERISYVSGITWVTINDGGAWSDAGVVYAGHDYSGSGSIYSNGSTQKLVDVSDTANIKVKFSLGGDAATISAGGTSNLTFAVFLRLGDT